MFKTNNDLLKNQINTEKSMLNFTHLFDWKAYIKLLLTEKL